MPTSHTPADPATFLASRFNGVVMQPTTLCNLDCGYCYLPDRKRERLMLVDVARRVAESVGVQSPGRPVSIIWHSGEPLATPIGHMRLLLAEFEQLRRAGAITHAVQTNATLINQQWIDLFHEYGVRVGISVDGPRHMNAARVDLRGAASFDRTIRGIDRLRAAGVPFTAICVVTRDTITHAADLHAFFSELGCASVGFNIEEIEGGSNGRPRVSDESAYTFWRELIGLRSSGSTTRVREIDDLVRYLDMRRAGRVPELVLHDPLPAVGHDGTVVLCSPELLGIHSDEYADFVVGNVLDTLLPDLIAHATSTQYVVELGEALTACASTCEFWGFCRGASAGNRFFEHGTFRVAETAYCRNTRQALVRAAADCLIREEVTR